jgi:hypothetical protein
LEDINGGVPEADFWEVCEISLVQPAAFIRQWLESNVRLIPRISGEFFQQPVKDSRIDKREGSALAVLRTT